MTTQLAGCVITNEAGEVLLLHRHTSRLTQWELPGGKVELGETTEQAAIREALEEIGVDVRITEHVGGTEFDDNGTHWAYAWFRAEIVSGKPRPCEPDKHDDVRYFNLLATDMSDVGISINIRMLIEATENRRFKL